MKKLIVFLAMIVVSTITFSQNYQATMTNIVKLNDTTILCIGEHNIMQDSIISTRFEYNITGDDVIYTKPCTTYNFSVEITNLANGNYDFIYVVETKDQGTISSNVFNFINTSDLTNINIPNIKLYPNPFTNYIIVDGIIQETYSIYNMNGKFIKNIKLIPNQRNNLDLPIGSYILKSEDLSIKITKNKY